jgi:allantoicase
MTAAFLDLIDLASERLGASVVAANDEFFAPKEALIHAAAPIWAEGKYTERGKWMDGWETRRRRDTGDHDWCIVRLGVPGIVRGVDVDTAFFKGNSPESCAIDACYAPGRAAVDDLVRASWQEIVPRTQLQGDAHNPIAATADVPATHLRLRIFPDGGVARLRVHGVVTADWERLRRRGDVDLGAAEHGGLVVGCSDMFFGSRHNLIMPGDATHMGDGWETKRRRGPGYDWSIIRLGAAGTIRRVEVDTRHFKGNAPGACSLEGALAGQGQDERNLTWRDILPRVPLHPHARHEFEDELQRAGDVSHVRFNIYPDGGVGRLRLFGRPR